MTQNKLNIAGQFYLEKGFNVIPINLKKAIIKNGKIEKQISFPNFEYGKYHKEKVTKALVDKWWGDYNAIAIITGKISGITVMDIDTKNLPDIKDLPETFTVETNKGFHFYFKHTDKVNTGANSFISNGEIFNIDIRNNGGIVFAPPSAYELPNGGITSYKVIQNLPLAEFSIKWLEEIYKKYKLSDEIVKGSSDWKYKITNPILEGKRNVDFTSIVGGLLNKFPQDEWETIVWKLVQEHNLIQKKPLDEHELRKTFNSIAKNESRKRNSGGEIKDIVSNVWEDNIDIEITLQNCIVCFRVKNIIGSLLEATVITWIKKSSGLSHEIPFYLKIKSDSNKEQWARLLSKTFDKKEDKEVYPWTILIAKVSAEVETKIRKHKQDFLSEEIVAKPTTWLIEPFIQEDQINTFFGLGSSGKTMMAMYFSALLLEKGTNSLFIDYENDSSNWKDKIDKITKDSKGMVYYDSEQIPLAEQVDKIKEVIKNRNVKLVILDSASLSTGESTSDEKAVIRLMSALKLLKTTVLLIAHQRKNDGDKTPIGSIQFENQARNVWNPCTLR